MRLFIAVELDDSLKAKVLDIESSLRRCEADVKFVERENLHLTLKFIGEVPEEFLPKIEEGISKALEGLKQFRISLEGVGYFGSPSYIRTLWVGVKEGQENLHGMMARLNRELDKFKRDSHGLNAHLTVGRVRSTRNREKLLEKLSGLSEAKVGEMLVKEVKLKQSLLSSKGPAYSDVKVFRLPA